MTQPAPTPETAIEAMTSAMVEREARVSGVSVALVWGASGKDIREDAAAAYDALLSIGAIRLREASEHDGPERP